MPKKSELDAILADLESILALTLETYPAIDETREKLINIRERMDTQQWSVPDPNDWLDVDSLEEITRTVDAQSAAKELKEGLLSRPDVQALLRTGGRRRKTARKSKGRRKQSTRKR